MTERLETIPSRELEPRERLGQAAAAVERAQIELKRVRTELMEEVVLAEATLSVADIAQVLGITRQQVYNYLKAARE